MYVNVQCIMTCKILYIYTCNLQDVLVHVVQVHIIIA